MNSGLVLHVIHCQSIWQQELQGETQTERESVATNLAISRSSPIVQAVGNASYNLEFDLTEEPQENGTVLLKTNKRTETQSIEERAVGSGEVFKTSRKSSRLQERQAANQQEIARGGQSRPLQRPAVKQYNCRKEEAQIPTIIPANPGAQKSTKRRSCANTEDELDLPTKRPRHRLAQHTTGPNKEDLIENWLEESTWSHRASTENEVRLSEALLKMPRKLPAVLPSPDNSFEGSISTSRKFEKSAANVHDTDYRDSLNYRNIYIECEYPPTELMRRANRLISRSRLSPEMDDATIQKLKDKSRKLQNEAEDKTIKQLAPHILPAMAEIPDQRLEMNADQPSYAVPDQKVRFPFLEIEFKSQAKDGTHYIATNQAAGAGAIALSGYMDLMQGSFGLDKFDYEEPVYFSISMDHELARINVHWLRAPVEKGGQHSFHVEGLSKHLLDDADGIRALSRAIKNILDDGADARLRTLCGALNAYRETVVRSRNTANAQRERQPEHRPESHIGQQSRRGVPASAVQVGVVASYEEVTTSRQPLGMVQPLHNRQQGRKGATAHQAGIVPSYEEVRTSRQPLEPVRPVNNEQRSRRAAPALELQMGEDMFPGENVRTSRVAPKPLEPTHTEQRPRRLLPTARRQIQNPVENPIKVTRLLSKRGSKVMDYD
ncbi:hypothetical protein MMC13_000198 [Lambiella insularis]|nr:hypothetical protein [Lambiella insularis]